MGQCEVFVALGVDFFCIFIYMKLLLLFYLIDILADWCEYFNLLIGLVVVAEVLSVLELDFERLQGSIDLMRILLVVAAL